VVPVLVDEKGNEVKGEGEGYLCIKQAWPATLRTVYGDHDRYETNYFKPFPGYYFSGDGARRDKDGYIWITGRVDDVINVSGHRWAVWCVRLVACLWYHHCVVVRQGLLAVWMMWSTC
jgi:acetyl-CoA synthetase